MKPMNEQSKRASTVSALKAITDNLKREMLALESANETFFVRVEIGSYANTMSWIDRLSKWFGSHDDQAVRDLNARWLADAIGQKRINSFSSCSYPCEADLAITAARNVVHSYVCSIAQDDCEPDFERSCFSY